MTRLMLQPLRLGNGFGQLTEAVSDGDAGLRPVSTAE
jgi:hypothetical protein